MPRGRPGEMAPPGAAWRDGSTASTWDSAEGRFCPRPEGINAGDLFSSDRVGERTGADAINVAAVIDQPAGRLDGPLGAWMHREMVRAVFPILNVPVHPTKVGLAGAAGKSVVLPMPCGEARE